jgi:hypothetical protein
LSIAAYAVQVVNFLHDQGFEYAEPDAKGGTFPGGILMDLGGGQRVAFFLPTDDIESSRKSLAGYLDDVYPSGHNLDNVSRTGGGLLMAHVRLHEGALALVG